MILLWTGDYSARTVWTLGLLIVGLWLGFAISVRHRVAFSLQTLSNLLAAMREEDFSVRARGARRDDAMGEVMIEVNSSARRSASSASAPSKPARSCAPSWKKSMSPSSPSTTKTNCASSIAPASASSRVPERLLGFTAAELGLGATLEGDSVRTMELTFPGGSGRWGMRRGLFRQAGFPHHLVVLSDLSRALRDEERQACSA